MTKVFVYGTLKRGYQAHDLMEGAQFLGAAQTDSSCHLFYVGHPAMIQSTPDGGVVGELYEVPDEILPRLHDYECVDSGLFRFGEIDLEDGSKANAYLYTGGHRGRKIEGGEWK
jgi:gamma-glutamylcyclotransferase (GGCT)/AIG2-like uncharacterized protein YtfP